MSKQQVMFHKRFHHSLSRGWLNNNTRVLCLCNDEPSTFPVAIEIGWLQGFLGNLFGAGWVRRHLAVILPNGPQSDRQKRTNLSNLQSTKMALKFCANLSFMFKENANLLDRYDAASKLGFKAVECAFPYEFALNDVVKAKTAANVEQVLINSYPG